MDDMKTMEMKPNIAHDLIRIHRVITRGLMITREKAQRMTQQGSPNMEPLGGFLDYLRSLTTVMHTHHVTEDEIGFPIFQKKSLDAPYDLLRKDHVEIGKLLNEITPLITTLTSHIQDKDTMEKIHDHLQTLSNLWTPHIQTEERYFNETIMDAYLSIKEQQQMSIRFAQHMIQHAKPDYLIIPFFLYNLPQNERILVYRMLPPDVTQTLVPVTWKDRWAPMKPFLLE
jgi:hemerythrin-like domain-containing protein